MRRLLIAVLAAMALCGLALSMADSSVAAATSSVTSDDSGTADDSGSAGSASADSATSADEAPDVDVLQVDGFFDEILVSEITTAIDRAQAQGSQALLLQVNSEGAVVSNAKMAELLHKVAASPIPVAVWVGPTGSKLYGSPAQLLAVADVTGMAPGAHVGNVGDPVAADIDLGPGLTALHSRTVGLSGARDLNVFRQRISDEGIPTVPSMLEALDGYEKNGVVISTTAEQVTDSGVVQRTTVAKPRFFKLPLIEQLFHTVASAPVAYLLLLIGMSLLIFEFFTAGIGVAGVVGAGSIILACYGLAALPTRGWAVALLVLAMVAFAIDVQVGVPRFWTGVGIVMTIVGSFWLYEPVSGMPLRPTWLSLLVGIGGVTLTYIVGMPSMTRTRFATPTIGREWMIGAEGVAVESVNPDGLVRINDATWQARTNRATPIAAGEALRVAAIDGVVLEVEPLEGAARDYREMRKHSDAGAETSSDTDTDAGSGTHSDVSA